MPIDYLISDPQEYISRGNRILSVLDGSGSVDVLSSRPDAKFDDVSSNVLDNFDPDIEFDPNSYSRMDKFDALEVGQEVIDSKLDAVSKGSTSDSSEEK